MSGMTDQEAMNTIDAYLPRHCRAALDYIADRLRGEAAQPVAVAGDAVRVLPEKWRETVAYGDHSPEAMAVMRCAAELATALSTQPAPSEQVAASVAVPDEATIDRLAHEAYEVHCNTPIGHFPNDSNFPKWRAVVRHVLAAAPVAPEREVRP